jgi:uncharacterized protein YjeT (DUF2065 family)
MTDSFWNSLIAGLCLMFIFEGLMPFIAPNAWRNTVVKIAQSNNRQIRMVGLSSMIMGVALLYMFL